MEDVFGVGKLSTNSIELIKMIYPDLAQPGVKKVGEALEIVLELSNTILIPLKMMNQKSSILFKRHMEKYEEKLQNLADEELTVVHPSIGLKILDELFTVTSEEIAELFTSLLTFASTKSGAKYAHPGFVEVIKNLSEDEAKIITHVFMKGKNVKYSFLVKYHDGTVPLGSRVTNLVDLVELTFPENSLFYLDNLLKVGIIKDTSVIMESDYEEHEKVGTQLEEAKKKAAETIENRQRVGEMLGVELDIHHGRYILNSYGTRFIECIQV